VPAAVTVLVNEDIEKSQSNRSSDILSTSALLNINRNGGQGGYSSITIRGGKPNFTLVQVDGIQVNDISDSLGGAVDFSALSTDNVQQVEIVRGPLSAVYGSDAVSGVINYVSRRGENQPALDVAGELGSFWTRGGQLSSTGRRGKFDYSLGGSFFAVDEQVKHDPYQLGSFAFHSGIALAGNKFLALTARFSNSVTMGFPVGGGGPEYSIVRDPQRIDASQFLTGISFDHKVGVLWSYNVAFDFFGRGQDFAIPPILDGNPPSFRSIPSNKGTTSFQRYHGSFTNTFQLHKSLTLHLAGGFRDEVGRSDSVLAGTIPDRYDLNRHTFSATGDLLYAVNRLTLNAGIRADQVSGLTSYFSPRTGLSYRIAADGLRFHSSWGKGFKLPSFYSLGDPLIGDKTLRPEFGQSADAGISADLFRKRVFLDTVYFYNVYRNLIDFSAQKFRLINRGEVRTQGIEFEAKAGITSQIQLRGSYTYLGWSLHPTDEPFRNVPRWRTSASIDWTSSRRWQLGADALIVASRADFQLPVPQQTVAGGYSTFTMRASYKLSDRVTGFLRIDNLLNSHYHPFIGFPDPGIYVRAGINYHALKPGARP
jgi:outer membrane cobalamin receptor